MEERRLNDKERLVILPDPDRVALETAAALVAEVLSLQAAGRVPRLVVTGGSIARKLHRAVLTAAGSDQIDWTRVEFWWGDERFVAADDPDRNCLQTREDLLDDLGVDWSRVHEMPASGAGLPGLDDAAALHAAELDAALGGLGSDEPWFDLLMLGIGPDSHCASLFPGYQLPAVTASVLPVRNSPKPPPERITLSPAALGKATKVWFIATGADKAEAVAHSVAGLDPIAHPSAGPRGLESTTWFLDEAVTPRQRWARREADSE